LNASNSGISSIRFSNSSVLLEIQISLQIFHNRGVGGTMLEAYGHDLGETVWGSTRAFPGCVLLYPLIALANERYNRTYTETTFYSAIVAVLRSKE